MISENDKNYFFNTYTFLQLNDKNFVWLEILDFLVIMLTVIPFCISSKQVINYLFFKYTDFLLEDQGMSNLFKKLKYYEIQPFVISIIFSFLKITYIEKEGVLKYYDWAKIVPILVKPDQTFSVLNFFIKLNVFGFLIKTKKGSVVSFMRRKK